MGVKDVLQGAQHTKRALGRNAKSSRGLSLGGILIGGVAVLLLLLPLTSLPVETISVGVLTLFATACWATGVLPEHVTALAFFFLTMLFSVASPNIVFSGFLSTAMWLVFSGLVIGIAITHTGLGEWLAEVIVGLLGTSYVSLVSGLVLIGLTLTFVMPSTIGRTLLLIPLVVALADRLGFAEGTKGRIGMVMAAALGTYMPAAAVLPASIPNLALAGVSETLYALPFHYGSFLVWHMPVTGLLKAIAIIIVTCWLFPVTLPPHVRETATSRMTPDQRILVCVLLVGLVLWITDALHHISPAWIGLGIALFCVLPGVELVPLTAFNGHLSLSSLLYLAGILGMSTMVAQSGLGELLGRTLLGILPLEPGQDLVNFAALVGMSTTVSLITTTVGVPAVLSPLAPALSTATGWPLLSVLMTQVIGYSTVIFPYQAPPLVLAMQLGRVHPVAGIRVTLMLTAVTLILLTPLNYAWWWFLGFFG